MTKNDTLKIEKVLKEKLSNDQSQMELINDLVKDVEIK